MPKHVKEAFLAVEDSGFYDHVGISFTGIGRALWKNLRGQRISQGASTITQQLTRTYFLTRKKTWKRKLKEIMLAIAIEHRMSKDEILEIYLNKIFLGNHSYGVEAAARNYFRKRVSQINISEAAMLAALPKAPSWLAPHRHFDRANRRKLHVLRLMRDKGVLSSQDYHRWRRKPIKVAKTPSRPNSTAPYYLDAVRQSLMTLFEWQELPSDGYKITTQFDLDVHRAVERGLLVTLDELDNKDAKRGEIQGAAVAIDLRTGGVVGLTGGSDFTDSQFNRAMRTRRQLGTVIVPFYLGLGIEKGYTLTHQFARKDPKNKFRPPVLGPTLYESIVMDKPYEAARLYPELGNGTVKNYLSRIGFRFEREDISLAVGYGEATPFEVATAATVVANQGSAIKPNFVSRVIDETDKVLFQRPANADIPVISPESAFLVKTLARHQLRRQDSSIGGEFGAFTGVTEDRQNGWTVAFNDRLLIVYWVGSEKGKLRLGRNASDINQAMVQGLKASVAKLPKPYLVPDPQAMPSGISFAQYPKVIDGEQPILPFLNGTEPQGTRKF